MEKSTIVLTRRELVLENEQTLMVHHQVIQKLEDGERSPVEEKRSSGTGFG